MTAVRMTQRLMTQHSLASLQAGLNRLSTSQGRLSSGKAITRPSDDPTGTNDAMRLRAALATGDQQARNIQDGQSWLTDADSTLTSMTDSARRARDLITQGSSTGNTDAAGREAIAQELTQIRAGLINDANKQHLGRPLFGGTTAGPVAYDPSGTYVGDGNAVNRTIGDGVTVPVNTTGPAAFSTGTDDLFTVLGNAIDQVRTNPSALSGTLTRLDAVSGQMTSALSSIGARSNQLDAADSALSTTKLDTTATLSSIEDVDIAAATMDVQMQTVAYQASLGATAKVIQPSLLDFLR
jgi:flagellar hook-associated protein 3 FlgL